MKRLGWAVDEAQARADKGAVLLQNSLVEGLSESEFNDLTRAAAQTLDQARIELEEVEISSGLRLPSEIFVSLGR